MQARALLLSSRVPGAIVSDISRAETIAQVPLTFSDWKPIRHLEDPLHKDLSAVTRIGDCLFLACDETASVERLRRLDDGSFGDHQHFVLDALVDLPAGAEGEMDIEGLCADGGFLWIVGSHSRKRSKPKRDENDHTEALRKMEEIEREPNRYFLGRVPLVEEAPGLFTPAPSEGERQAAWLRLGKRRSALERWLAADPHLGPFLSIPSKENGFDVEGLAVHGTRVWLGLRGPVLRGHAVVLDLELKQKAPDRLKAGRINGERRYRKHLLDTRGLGIRDMRFAGDDLLLLVGRPCPWKGQPLSCGGGTRRMMMPLVSSLQSASRQWPNCPTSCMWIIRKGLNSGQRPALEPC
jgi:hypothetical protein